jgi:hypothetical protein
LGELARLFEGFDREANLDICEEVLGHAVETTKDLTRSEADLVIQAVAARAFQETE